MSAVLRDTSHLVPMTVHQLGAVLAIEQAVYPFAWTRGNFIDSLAVGHAAQVLLAAQGEVLGYFVAMHGVQEMHLLNITVAPGMQGCGHGRYLLDAVCDVSRAHHAARLWLEVRASNERALAFYQRSGFERMGMRRDYYPASRATHPNGREDAWVMSLTFSKGDDGLE